MPIRSGHLKSFYRLLITNSLLLMAILLPGATIAHEIRPAIVDMDLKKGTYTLRIRANLEALMAEIAPQHSDTDESVNAPRYNSLRAMAPAELSAEFEVYQDTFLGNLKVRDAEGNLMAHKVQLLSLIHISEPTRR